MAYQSVLDAHEAPTLPGNHAGYVLRILGPMEMAGKYEWYELTLAPGGELTSQAHHPGTNEHLTKTAGAARPPLVDTCQVDALLFTR